MTTPPKSNEPCWCGSGRKYKRCHKPADNGVGGRDRVAQGAARVLARADAGRLLRPGLVGPHRPVPPHIPRPDYAVLGKPLHKSARLFTTPEDVARMRTAGLAAAEILVELGEAVTPGITTDALDALCHEACLQRGGYPSPLNYGGFPKSLCTSVNEVICHGIPDSRPLEDGDIINLDVTIYLDGVHGDTSATFLVGDVDDESRRLVAVTRQCLDQAIATVHPGGPLNAIGRAIQTHAEANGFGVVRAFVGHGVGEVFHTDPQIPHYFDPQFKTLAVPGMTFTIEPMITAGAWQHQIWPDRWTAVTADGSRTAQFEHAVLVTHDGVEVLTRPPARAVPDWATPDAAATR